MSNLTANDIERVPRQCKHFASSYSLFAISPELASKKFIDVNLLLVELNAIFRTNIPISYPGVQKTLNHLISEGHDLGAIYARMHPMWPTLSVPSELFLNHNSACVIGSTSLASKKCRDVYELLTLLNRNFRTKISMHHSGVKEVLRCLIRQGYSFGDICTIVTEMWPRTSGQEKEWARVWGGERMNLWEDFQFFVRRGEEYERSRQTSLRHDNTIVRPLSIKPRRIWDLFAHRVIPFQFSLVDADHYDDAIKKNTSSKPLQPHSSGVPARLVGRFRPMENDYLGYRYYAVSHSWTEDMAGVPSPVNAREWPIPLPKDVTLEAVRTELLNMGAQYVWLDVVCLRQKSLASHLEALRIQEWKIDLPTVGWIYTASNYNTYVIRYFNGLGKAFRSIGWRDKRHWSQRAWTLQEVGSGYLDAGVPEGVENVRKETDENGVKLSRYLNENEIRQWTKNLYRAVPIMKKRHSEMEVDRVLGLSALLGCDPQIAYLEGEEPEHAWTRLIRTVSKSVVTDLLLYCLLPGENGCYWRPSWSQLMQGTRVVEDSEDLKWICQASFIHREYLDSLSVDDHGYLHCRMPLIEGCKILAPSDPVAGTVLIETTTRRGRRYKWAMTNQGAQDIAPGEYVLAGAGGAKIWLLCKKRSSGKLKKVCVLITREDESDLQFWARDLRMSPRQNVVFC